MLIRGRVREGRVRPWGAGACVVSAYGVACERVTKQRAHRQVRQENLWAFKGWADLAMRQQRVGAVVSALNLAVAWFEARDELTDYGKAELGGVMRRLVEVVPECSLIEIDLTQSKAVRWLLELGEVQGCEQWALGGEVLDVNLFRRWLVGCGLDAV